MPAAVRVLAVGLLVAVLVAVGPARTPAQDKGRPARLALVIGEAAYPQARLPTAAADAGLMASSFMQAGFDVTAIADADAELLRKTVADFVAKVRSAGPDVVVALYVVGDGLQYSGENWLVPVGARIDREDEVPGAAIRLGDLTSPLEALPATTRLFLFDLARETPFARHGAPLAGGLALAEAPVGSIDAFNTAPGAVAPPDVPPYGAYARSLAEAMQGPGLTIGEVLRRTRLRMGERTDGAAIPFDDGSADPGFAFYPGPPTAAAPLAAVAGLPPAEFYSTAVARDTLPGYVAFVAAFPRDPLVGRVRAMAAARREALFWSEAVRANTPRAYWTYMRRYPRGPHYGDVRRQLFALHAALEPPPRFDVVPFEGLPPPSVEELAALDHPFLAFADADGPSIPPPPPAMLPAIRSAFFELAPPPPLARAGALPLPLPVPTPDGQVRSPGRIEQPAAAGGALVTTSTGDRGAFVLITTRPDGTIVSRVTEAISRNTRTILEQSATGASIAKVTVVTSTDGTSTITQVGPADRLLGRTVSRDGAAGARATTLFDAGDQPVATTIVSASGIVVTSALVPGRMMPPRFVLAAAADAKGVPVIAPDGEVMTRARPTTAPDVRPPNGEAKTRRRGEGGDFRRQSAGTSCRRRTDGAGAGAEPPAAAAGTGLRCGGRAHGFACGSLGGRRGTGGQTAQRRAGLPERVVGLGSRFAASAQAGRPPTLAPEAGFRQRGVAAPAPDRRRAPSEGASAATAARPRRRSSRQAHAGTLKDQHLRA